MGSLPSAGWPPWPGRAPRSWTRSWLGVRRGRARLPSGGANRGGAGAGRAGRRRGRAVRARRRATITGAAREGPMGVLDAFRLDVQVALVSGGSRGLGLQMAEALGEVGAAVAITARKPEGLEEARAHLERRGVRCLLVRCNIADAGE